MTECVSLLKKARVELIWLDSLGAKSFSVAINLGGPYLVIDPGASEMQPSYPLPHDKKRILRRKAVEKLERYCGKAKVLIITHYHYDHHLRVDDKDLRNVKDYVLKGKYLILKNPNVYINESQWRRARNFIDGLLKLNGKKLDNYLVNPPKDVVIEDPIIRLTEALSKDFGQYNERRAKLLEKGLKWFTNLVTNLWTKEPWIKEGITLNDGTTIIWGDGRKFQVYDVEISILSPWFHGVEYDRTGWVTPVVIKVGNYRIFYSSDVMGPIIEDYASFIYKLRPDIILLDGPPTYLYPYMFNRINLRRAVENAITIIKAKPKLVLYDHHLLREKKWRERTAEVYSEARKEGVHVLTAAECLGEKPLIDIISM